MNKYTDCQNNTLLFRVRNKLPIFLFNQVQIGLSNAKGSSHGRCNFFLFLFFVASFYKKTFHIAKIVHDLLYTRANCTYFVYTRANCTDFVLQVITQFITDQEEPGFCQLPVISRHFARNEKKIEKKIPSRLQCLCQVIQSRNADFAELCRVKMLIAELCRVLTHT